MWLQERVKGSASTREQLSDVLPYICVVESAMTVLLTSLFYNAVYCPFSVFVVRHWTVASLVEARM